MELTASTAKVGVVERAAGLVTMSSRFRDYPEDLGGYPSCFLGYLVLRLHSFPEAWQWRQIRELSCSPGITSLAVITKSG
jgi:hypothetical protein